MAGAGLLAGLIIYFLGDPGEADLIVNNVRFKGGRLEPKNNPAMILSSWLCIASGGSAGPEAPQVQVVGSTGTWIARKLKIRGEDLGSLSIAGMAAAFTALFGAPLGGTLFALEIFAGKWVLKKISPSFFKRHTLGIIISSAIMMIYQNRDFLFG